MYLDNAASAPLDAAVALRMAEVGRQRSANPASIHRDGLRAAREVEAARLTLGEGLGVDPSALIFTSGATEANNLAIKGVLWASPPTRRRLLVSAVEHPSVLEPARWLAEVGAAELALLPVDREGRVRQEALAALLDPRVALVSVQAVNNETGVVQPIAALAATCRAAGAPLHVDATQALCKLPPRAFTADLITVNAHKIHGPKGVGALYAAPGLPLCPLLHGGGHEGGLRAGTLNTAGVVGFAEAVARYPEAEGARLFRLRCTLLQALRARWPSLRLNGSEPDSAGSILNVAWPGTPGKALFQALDRRGIRCSASSACHATKLTPSPVLLAMGQSPEQADEALRLSFGRFTTEADLEALLAALEAILGEEGRICA